MSGTSRFSVRRTWGRRIAEYLGLVQQHEVVKRAEEQSWKPIEFWSTPGADAEYGALLQKSEELKDAIPAAASKAGEEVEEIVSAVLTHKPRRRRMQALAGCAILAIVALAVSVTRARRHAQGKGEPG
jgi:hypothetical protein